MRLIDADALINELHKEWDNCECQKCGLCGRMFDVDGNMVDDGGTTPEVYI